MDHRPLPVLSAPGVAACWKRVASFDLDLNQVILTQFVGNQHE
jgi:hypothetical protein